MNESPLKAAAAPRDSQSGRGAAAGVWRILAARRAGAACALLLLVMSAQMLAVVARKSITTDEVSMIPSAYHHLAAGELRLVNEHPPFAKLLAGLPLLFVRPKGEGCGAGVPDDAMLPLVRRWDCVGSFWEENRASFEAICFWARVPAVALSAALGVLVFLYARDLFGARAGVLAVALYAAEPTVLGHGRLVQTDVPAAFGYLLVFYALRAYAAGPRARSAAGLGASAGVALLTKFSMLLAGPALAAGFALLLWRARRGPKGGWARLAAHACAAALAALFVVNAAYFFGGRPFHEDDARLAAEVFPSAATAAARAVSLLSLLLPTDFLHGALWQLKHNAEGHPASLLGMHGRTGWWYYFPVAFALKTSLPFLLLSVASLAWGCHELARRRDRRFLWLLAPFAAYTAFVLLSRINIGVRYYLPAYPFLFVAGGALLARLLDSRRARRAAQAAAVSLLCWVGVEAARAWPDHIPYMNQLARPRPHWHYLSDSNVEWGDDIRALAEYLRARGETRVRASLLGNYPALGFYGVEYVELAAPPGRALPATRYVALGASYLNGSTVPPDLGDGRALPEQERVNFFDAYRRRAPEAVIGGSIYVFREAE